MPLTPTTNAYQLEERPRLQGLFDNTYTRESGSLGLTYVEANARFQRFVTAAYEAPNTAVSVAREDTEDIALAGSGEPLYRQLELLLRANNPSRACKLYMTCMAGNWTKDNHRKVRLMGLGGAAVALLVTVGACAGIVSVLL